jgi:hypothetical protein
LYLSGLHLVDKSHDDGLRLAVVAEQVDDYGVEAGDGLVGQSPPVPRQLFCPGMLRGPTIADTAEKKFSAACPQKPAVEHIPMKACQSASCLQVDTVTQGYDCNVKAQPACGAEHGGAARKEIDIPIIVGGEQHEWHHHEITYEELLGLLFPNGSGNADYPHSISYSVPGKEEGIVHRGEAVRVAKGIKFYVRSAHKS